MIVWHAIVLKIIQMPDINTAIVGFGRWGQLLYDASKSSRAINVTTAVTRTPVNVQELCDKEGLVLTDDFQQVLADPAIDALVIATPHSQHYEQLKLAAGAGKHVYCEKPFTLEAAQAEEVLDLFEQNNCKVAIGHNRRFAPNTVALKNLINDGFFGELLHIDGVFNADLRASSGRWRDSTSESPAGGMTSLGIHVVDIFIHLMGRVKRISAQSWKITEVCAFDDHTSAQMEFESGVGGHLLTLASAPMKWQISLYGTGGTAEMHGLDTLIKTPANGESEKIVFPGFTYPGNATLGMALDAFGDDCLGVASFPITPSEIAHGTAVLESVIVSAGNNVDIEIQ